MSVPKALVVIFSLCFVHGCLSLPTTGHDLTEGRGFMSSIWGWITYPFSWWSSEETEQPVTQQLIGSATNNLNDIVDIRSHNVTIWCNDQTCTTMKCDKTECRNITCNLYDTDFRGECKEYNIISEEYTVPRTTEIAPIVPIHSKITEKAPNVPIYSKLTEKVQNVPIHSKLTETANKTTAAKTSNEKDNNPTADEHPLELEAVLSSTVNKHTERKHTENKENATIHKIKV